MKRIVYEASFGMEKKIVDLGFVPGAGGIWHLYVDKYYLAQFSKTEEGKWRAHFHRPPGWVTGADIEVLCNLIERLELEGDTTPFNVK